MTPSPVPPMPASWNGGDAQDLSGSALPADPVPETPEPAAAPGTKEATKTGLHKVVLEVGDTDSGPTPGATDTLPDGAQADEAETVWGEFEADLLGIEKLAETLVNLGNTTGNLETDLEKIGSNFIAQAKAEAKIEKPLPRDLANLEAGMAGGFSARSPLGQKFSREVDKATFSSLGQQEKADFRKEWAGRCYRNLQETKYKDTAYQVIDTKKGEYVTLPLLIDAFGGRSDRSAIKAGLAYAAKCVKLGHPWYEFNEMAEVTEFLHLRKEHREVFKTVWGLRSSSHTGSPAIAEQASSSASGNADPGGSAGGKRGAGKEGKETPVKAAKKEVDPNKEPPTTYYLLPTSSYYLLPPTHYLLLPPTHYLLLPFTSYRTPRRTRRRRHCR
jgi:hypothetical protein